MVPGDAPREPVNCVYSLKQLVRPNGVYCTCGVQAEHVHHVSYVKVHAVVTMTWRSVLLGMQILPSELQIGGPSH